MKFGMREKLFHRNIKKKKYFADELNKADNLNRLHYQ